MTVLDQFVWGLGASLAVEVFTAYQTGLQPNGHFKLPPRYYSPVFLVIRVIIASFGDGLAVAHGVQTILLAINIGAATPLILQGLAQQAPTGINESANQ